MSNNISVEIYNEVIKWFSSAFTTLGMSVLILAVVRPVVQGNGIPDIWMGCVGLIPLVIALWNLTNLRPKDG